MNEQTEEDQAQRDLFELVALDSNLSIADRKISQLRKLRMDSCGNLVKPTDPDYAECAEVKRCSVKATRTVSAMVGPINATDGSRAPCPRTISTGASTAVAMRRAFALTRSESKAVPKGAPVRPARRWRDEVSTCRQVLDISDTGGTAELGGGVAAERRAALRQQYSPAHLRRVPRASLQAGGR
jgi:hypothetical protein